MGFDIVNKLLKEGITKDQFLNSDFVGKLNDKEKQRLASVFDQFNTNNEGDSKDKLDADEQMDMLAWFKNIAGKNNKVSRHEMSDNKANGTKYSDYKNFMNNYTQLAKDGEIEATYYDDKSVAFNDGNDSTFYEKGKKNFLTSDRKLDDGTSLHIYKQANGLNNFSYFKKDGKETTIRYNYALNAKKGDIPAQVKVEKDGQTATYNYDTQKKMYTSDGKTFYTLDENGLLKEYKEPVVEEKHVASQPEKKVQQKIRPQFEKPTTKVHLPSAWNNKRTAKDGVAEELKLNETYTADEVMDKMMTKFNIDKTKIQADKLKADLIKYNPSIFDKDGNVMEGVDWSNLDFPQNAGTLYKLGVQTPTVKKSGGSAPVRRSNPAGGTGQAGQTRQTKNLPQDATTNLPTKGKPVKRQSTPFTDGTKWGVSGKDPRTGANLDGSPLPIGLQKYGYNGVYYCQKSCGKTYYYDSTQRLIRVDGSRGERLLTIIRDNSGRMKEYYEQEHDSSGRILSRVKRDTNGKVSSYSTYEYDMFGNQTRDVERDVNGNPLRYVDYEYDSRGAYSRDIYRSVNGKVRFYYDYKTQKYYNPDGTEM